MRNGRIDYRLQRRAVLRDVSSGVRSADDVCDAHPELLRAAAHLGVPAGGDCPLCPCGLVNVTYVFDRDRARHPGGRAIDPATLAAQTDRYGELRVYVVEVCRECHWHHLVESFLAQPAGVSAG